MARRPCIAATLEWKGLVPHTPDLLRSREGTQQSDQRQLNKEIRGEGHKKEQESWSSQSKAATPSMRGQRGQALGITHNQHKIKCILEG